MKACFIILCFLTFDSAMGASCSKLISFSTQNTLYNLGEDNTKTTLKLELAWDENGPVRAEVITSDHSRIELDVAGDWTNLGPEDRQRTSIVSCADVDFDGDVDILIEQSSGTAGQLFKLFRNESGKKLFVRSEALDEAWNPVFDASKKIIQAGQSGGKKDTFKWKESKLVKAKK